MRARRTPRRATTRHVLVRRGARHVIRLCVVVVGATTVVVLSGALRWSPAAWRPHLGPAKRLPATDLTAHRLPSRDVPQMSRSADDRIAAADSLKARTLQNGSGPASTHSVDLGSEDPRKLAQSVLPQFGFSSSQFPCLADLWNGESGWNVHAENASSHAYGIPQALPGSKMSSAGPDWRNNALTQIRWGLEYIKRSYGSPCGAEQFKSGHGWY